VDAARESGRHLSEAWLWRALLQLLLGLHHMHHERRTLHRDVKALNVFLDAGRNVRIGDLGVARVLAHTRGFARTFVGTPFHLAPEMVRGLPYDRRADVWSLGVLLHQLCALDYPFPGVSSPPPPRRRGPRAPGHGPRRRPARTPPPPRRPPRR